MNLNETTNDESTGSQSREQLCNDLGKLLLRISVAGLMLFHGIAKLNDGVGSIEGMLSDAGLPTLFAYGVYIGEVIVPLMMIAGFLTRLSSIVFAFNMLVAVFLGHTGELLSLNQYGGWAIELPLLYMMGAVCIALLGPGRFSASIGKGIWQ